MLTKSVSYSAKGAIEYFDDGLSRQDYYSEKGEVLGKWHGLAAEKLGLKGEIEREDFVALAKNRLPESITEENPNGEKLTPRDTNGRKVGYDFTFSVSKSVSLAYSLTKDEAILSVVQNSVNETMRDMEKLMATQARDENGKKFYQNTGNMVWGSFVHKRARPVEVKVSDGLMNEIKEQYKGEAMPDWVNEKKGTVIASDPNLHVHNYIFNATYNEKKDRFQAGEFDAIFKNRQLLENMFHSRVAKGLQDIGYTIERNRNNFDVVGFDKGLQDKFSNRRKDIVKIAEEKGANTALTRQEAALTSRLGKQKGMDEHMIHKIWWDRLDDSERNSVNAAKSGHAIENKKERITEKEAIDYAINHSLERLSVVDRQELLVLGVKRGMGSITSLEGLKKELDHRSDLLVGQNRRGKTIYTKQEALDEEASLKEAARNGRGQLEPINPDYQIQNDKLSEEQAKAVNHVLQSKDLITIVAGGAGVGKTWSIKEVAKGVEEAGIGFHAFAPSASASRGTQKEEGFENADTNASLLINQVKQQNVKNGVIWIDEAGMVGNQTMNQIIDIAKQQNARLLLTGDIKQHNSVERGDALRIIQDFGGIEPAYIKTIRRQQTDQYKKAVKAISSDNLEKGFEILDSFGAIKQSETFTGMLEKASKEYADARENKENTLVVATTHAQGKATTEAIRTELKDRGLLDAKERQFMVYTNQSYTEAEKQDTANYKEGMTVQFHKKVPGFKNGYSYQVKGQDKEGNIIIGNKKKEMVLPMKESESLSVFRKDQISIANKDLIRITKNGSSKEKTPLNNGDIVRISNIKKNGDIVAYKGKDRVTIDKDYGNFTHGYYTTSPSSQGKSVNRVIIMQGTSTGKAASKEQFYVSASRGKFAISIHTDDKEYLMKSVQNSSQRDTASQYNWKENNQQHRLDKMKKMASMCRVEASKSKETWHNGKDTYRGMISMTPKPPKPPVKHVAPVKIK